MAQKGTNNPAAYDEYLKGREHYFQVTKEGSKEAEACFKRALELDPKFSRARAALAQTHYIRANLGLYKKGGMDALTENRLWARHHLQEAMREPTPLAYCLAGNLDLDMRKHDEAVSHLGKALSLDPNDPVILGPLSWALSMAGRPAEAMEHARKGMRVDPINPDRFFFHLGVAHFCAGEWEEAAARLEKALNTPGFLIPASLFLVATYVHLGRDEKARTVYENFRKASEKTNPGWPISLGTVMGGYAFKDRRVAESLAEGLLKAGVPGRLSDYIHLSKKDQVVGEDLRALFTGTKLIGVNPDGSQFSFQCDKDGERCIYRGPPFSLAEGTSWTGEETCRVRFEGDTVCLQYERFLFAMEFGQVVYKTPRGSPEGKHEYVSMFDIGGMIAWSLVR